MTPPINPPEEILRSGQSWTESFDGWGMPTRWRPELRRYFSDHREPSSALVEAALCNNATWLVIAARPEELPDLYRLMIWLANEPVSSAWGSTEEYSAWLQKGVAGTLADRGTSENN